MDDSVALAVLSSNVQRLMDARGWSLRRLAKETGDPLMTLHNTVTGKHLPRAGMLLRIAKTLDVSVDDLFDVELAKKITAARQ